MNESPSALAQAFGAYQLGELGKAQHLGTEVLTREPNNLQALHLLSMVASAMGDRRRHRELLGRILALAPNHVPSLVALANDHRFQGDTDKGVHVALRAIAIAPSYAGAHNALGLCLQSEGKHVEAIERFRQAIQLDSSAAILWVNLGVSLHHLGRLEDALSSYRSAERLAPNVPEIYEGIARIYGVQKRRFEAVENLEKALSMTPSSTTRLLQLAEAKAMVGEIGESLSLVLTAIALDPNSAQGHYQHGLRLQDMGAFEEAAAAFERSIELNPGQGGAYCGLVTSRKITQLDHPLVVEIQSLIGAEGLPSDQLVLLHTALGKVYDDVADYENAVIHVDEANRLESCKVGWAGFNVREFEQYVSRMIETFSPGFFELRKDWSLGSDLPIFIVGLPRSGTTLTESILSSHPEIEAAGEQIFWPEADSTSRVVLLGNDKEASLDLGRAYLQILSKIGPTARFVTDKRPDNFLFLGLLHALFPRAKIVHCVRDIKDNAVSLYMTPYRVRPAFVQTMEGIVGYIDQYRRLMSHWGKVLPDGTLYNLSYEELVDDQERITQNLLEFCGLSWNDRCLRPEENTRSVATPSNWQARQSVYRSSVQRWKRYEPFLGQINRLDP